MSVIIECKAIGGRAVSLDAPKGVQTGIRRLVHFTIKQPTSMTDEDYEQACKSPVFRAWLKDGDLVNLTALGMDEEPDDQGDAEPASLDSIATSSIVESLKEAGYVDLETLSMADTVALTQIKGIGARRAEQLLEDARKLIGP